MKKIFAFVLASLMVLSLVPASAFAAVTKCPAVHTSTNCDATLLYTSMADCENVGYQAYVCDDCGAQFMDNLKPKANHTWVSDPELAANDIEANCVYQANGRQYLICSVCDTTYSEEIDGETVPYKTIDYRSAHKLALISGVGCEKLYQCSLCDAKGYMGKNDAGDAILTDDVSHEWKFVEIETEPKWEKGKAYKGSAVYACEDCVATKKVDIDTPFCHESNQSGCNPPEDYVVVVKPKNATCTAKGARLIAKCADCGELWYCDSTTCATDHKEYEDHKWKSADKDNDYSYTDTGDKKHTFNALGHKDAAGNKNGDTNECGKPYYCVVCNTWQTQGHDYAVMKDANGNDLIVNPTCTTDGYVYRQCKDCYYIQKYIGDDQEATGHAKTDWIYVEATCKTAAFRYKKCTNWACSTVPTYINGEAVKVVEGIEYIGSPNPNGHNFTSIPGASNGVINMENPNKDLYCTGFTYEFKFCANGCAEYGNGKAVMSEPVLHDLYVCYSAHNFSKEAGGLAAFHTQVKYACKKAGCNYVSAAKDIPDTVLVQTTFDDIHDAAEFFGYTKRTYLYNAATDEVELVKEELRAAFTSFGTVEALIAAKFTQVGLPTQATCQSGSSATYAVTEYGTYITISGPKNPHVPGKVIPGTPATCLTPGTHESYECKNCGVTYWQDKSGKQYTSAPIKNPCSDTIGDEPVAGACGGATEYWQCEKCNTCYTDATCAQKCLPTTHTYVTLHTGVAATCNTTGIPEVRYCSVCGALEINLVYMNGGKELRVNFNEDGGNKATISTTWLSAAVEVVVDESGAVTFKYDSDNDGTAEEWSSWPSNVTVKKMENSSNHRGIYNAIVTEGEDGATVVTAGNVLQSGLVKASAVTFGNSEKAVATTFKELDHTMPYFKLVNCAACVYEYIKDYVPAQGGHVNSKGNLITEDCADGAKGDRVCVTCYDYYAEIAESEGVAVDKYAEYYTFGAHSLIDASSETGYTCQSAGYDAELCTKCGLYVVDSDSYQPANAKKFHDELKAAIKNNNFNTKYKCQRGPVADYAQDGNSYYACYICETALTTATATPCPGTGLEINMSTAYGEYMPNSYVELVISLDSLKGVDAWGLNFSVGYNPDVVKFVKADFSASPFGTNVANAVSGPTYTMNDYGMYVPSTSKVPYGVVSVASSSTDGVALKGNNEYAVLVFQVIESGYEAQFSIGYIQPWQAGERDPLANIWYKANAVGANGKAIKVNYNVDATFIGDYIVPASVVNKSIVVFTLTFLDLDENGELDIFDAFELYYLIETDTYSVLADADHDGDVDTDDLDILYAVLVGEKSLKDILKGETEGEEERVIEYDDNGFVTYDSLYDLNEDGVLSQYEIAVMTGKIDADLNPNT